jgi:uncharacterized DUF497 family protein
MRIRKVLIEESTAEKIFRKHGVRQEEMENGMLEGNPLVFSSRDARFIAFVHYNRYLTIVFSCKKCVASVITAYPSSAWQVRMYRQKRK